MGCYTAAADALREAGYRLTPQRLMVLEALYHHTGYSSADEIWVRVRTQYPHVDLSTIYRSVHFLRDQGLVSELHTPTGPVVYSAIKEDPHAHAVCKTCGAILNVKSVWLDELLERLAAERGFRADIPNLEIPGLCDSCS